jgi:hypothetical protein
MEYGRCRRRTGLARTSAHESMNFKSRQMLPVAMPAHLLDIASHSK